MSMSVGITTDWKNDRLRTGVIYYGSTQVLSGLDRNTDWIAFPYGKQVKDGAATREATTDELYNY